MKIPHLILFAMIAVSISAQAQQPAKKTPAPQKAETESERRLKQLTAEMVNELLDSYFARIKKETAAGKDVLQKDDSQKLIEYFNTGGDLRARRDKIYGEKYSKPVVFQSLPGESGRISLLKGIPAPKDPAAALQADPRENQRYAEKVKRLEEQAAEEARRIFNTTEIAKAHKRGGDAAVLKIYEDKANKSEFVQEMGGVQAIQNMSEKERAEAAKKMVANRTGGYTVEEIKKMTPEQKQALAYQMAANRPAPGGNEVGTAFTKELMVNEAYRKRYEKMNDAEKQAEYKKFEERYNGGPGSSPVEKNTPGQMSADEREARDIIEFNKIMEQYRNEMKAIFDPIDRLSQQYEQEAANNYQMLSRWVEAATEKLPTVSDSEYGPRKDGIEMVIFTEAVMAYAIGKDKIGKEREVWEKYMRAHIIGLQKLDEIAAGYAKRSGFSDQMKLSIGELSLSGFDAIFDLNKKADYITTNAASIQLSYNCNALHDCSDPRQDKYSSGN